MTPRRIIIVGPSGSGKTTVAQAVARNLGLPCISMDDFRERKTIYIRHRGKPVRTFEDPRNWDQNAIAGKLRAICQADGGFVAEGNHLLYYPAVAALPEQERYYLDVPLEVSVERRKTRHRYLPADESFALIGKIETAKYVIPQLEIPGVILLDGTRHTYETGHAIIHRKIRQVCTLDV